MDLLTSYKLMSDRFYDSENNMTHVPEELFDYFQNLGKGKKVKSGKYVNLDEFIEKSISCFVETSVDIYYAQTLFRLELTDGGYVDFKLEPDAHSLPYRLTFSVNRKDSYGQCLMFTWFPFNKTIYLNGLLYEQGAKKKIIASKVCYVSNIPKKAGQFFLEMISDIGVRLDVKRILLKDVSTIFLKDNIKMSLSLFYLKKNGITYYTKFGYKPVELFSYNSDIYQDIMFDLPTRSAEEEIEFIKNKLNKIGDLDLVSTIREFKKLEYHMPVYYEKYL